jgi:hypothetical protein
MVDNFDFAALAKSWQQQTVAEEAPPSAADLAQASQRQREQKLLMYAEWLGALIMAAAAAWLLVNLPGLLGGDLERRRYSEFITYEISMS